MSWQEILIFFILLIVLTIDLYVIDSEDTNEKESDKE